MKLLDEQAFTLRPQELKPKATERLIQCELEFTSIPTRQNTHPFKKCNVTKCYSEYPIRIMLPTHASDSCCRWVYNVIFGGGLVSGDEVSANIRVKDNCCVLWTSQSFQKVYVSGQKGPCCQTLRFQLGAGSLLAVLADPIVCYRDAIFHQVQEVRLTQDSNLVFLDWYTAGRTARGEWWAFKSLFSEICVYIDDQLAIREALELANTPTLQIKDSMGDFGVLGTCIIMGPYLQQLSRDLVSNLNARKDYGVKLNCDCLISASPLYSRVQNADSSSKESLGCLLRIGATNSSLAYKELAKILSPLSPLFGGNPFENKF